MVNTIELEGKLLQVRNKKLKKKTDRVSPIFLRLSMSSKTLIFLFQRKTLLIYISSQTSLPTPV